MIDLNADIISNHSLGNICLGQSIDVYLEELLERFTVETKIYPPAHPQAETMHGYFINHGAMVVFTNSLDIIVSVGCNQTYSGKYRQTLYPGITMEKLSMLVKEVRILHGALIVDNDYGLSFPLPSPHDELADHLHQIPPELTLNEIYVYDHSPLVPNVKNVKKKRK
ncbi:hypothetical protein GA0061071_106178 [Kosakonia oryzendophytica]|uniref:Uncharacterized protein n=1 Tax=Kosakonia oryzendophytica TaxID=1005665 RepID=A0A1C4C1M3_9ENTR|nr:hypothetical protein [Kosakonia oryzendophytica]AMO46712.1 Hypothetical protein AKI40_0284 [Enterobacter sp. FY-07]TDT51554.1 hypothetical protein DFO53_4057 [Enterobacter sp. AG5470]WBT58485.1 hypothetical protein O9K67_01405 [Kosakonia oryzendophytica]SCC12995.1 hypothetical protein GA0061071_106178 [Kosakonia oryzendophytica]